MLAALFRRTKIRALLLVSFVLLNVSLLAILGSVSYRTAADETVQSAGQGSLASLTEANERLGTRLVIVEDTAMAISLNPHLEELLSLREGDPGYVTAGLDMRELLAPYGRHPEIAAIRVIVPDDKVFLPTTGPLGLLAQSEVESEDWYAPARNFDFGWLELHPVAYANLPAETVVTYIQKLYHHVTGALIGTIAIDVRLSTLYELLRTDESVGPLFLARGAGEYVGQVTGHPVAPDVRALVARQNEDWNASYTEVQVGGEAQLLLKTTSTRGGWRLLRLIPVRSLTGGLVVIREAMLGAGAVLALASVLLAWILARAFGRPIDELIGLMKRMGAGQLDARAGAEYQNEFGELHAGFNRMAEQLQQLVADLHEENRRKRRAELEALQAQINPHFLYNTLDSINWMAIAQKQETISQAVTLLGRFFRLGLSKGDTLVPLSQELEHLRTYIQLQQIRFRGSFQFHESVPPELIDCRVPKIVLQPLLENALTHAFRERGGRGTVQLTAKTRSGNLVLAIQDDGIGMDPAMTPDPRRTGSGYGIRNVHERIRLHFGPPYGIEIESRPGEGTLVLITLPLIRKEEGNSHVESPVGR